MVYSALKGRIGNNLFQIAAGLSLAKQNNTVFAAYVQKMILPEPDNCLLSEYLNQFRKNLLRNIILLDVIPGDAITYEEPVFSFNPIKYEENIILDGYFQSEKYFDKKLISKIFSIDNQTLFYIKSKFGAILSKEITSINVRRGDFTFIPQLHPVCSMTYFKKAINYIGKEKQFLIISDDIVWCKKKFKGENYLFVEDESPVVDLYLQALCTNNIISNSSFSWWGAWLNQNPGKLVIAPSENWVGKLHPFQDTEDLIPSEWIKLSNPLKLNFKIRVLLAQLIRILIMIKKTVEKIIIGRNG